LPSNALTVTSPANGANVSGTITITGQAGAEWVNITAFDNGNGGLKVGNDVTPLSGAYSISVDTTLLANGLTSIAVTAYSVPAGQTSGTSTSVTLSVNVENAAVAQNISLGSPSIGTGTCAQAVPVGGPGGYSGPIVNDCFGSSKAGANVTSYSQFNPSTPYGANGTGWDLWAAVYGESKSDSVNAAMQPDHLEIYPSDTGNGDFMVSHFEFLPTASTKFYVEIHGTTGAGQNPNQANTTTWPAYWFFPGNGPTDYWSPHSELDGMETYDDQAIGPQDSDGSYTHYFGITSHTTNNDTVEEYNIIVNNDINVNYNVYGFEFYLDSAGNVLMDAYFNGKLVGSLSQGLPWQASPPAIFLGYNPGSTAYVPATMMIDYVRVWQK
jgi:hypothetical protein